MNRRDLIKNGLAVAVCPAIRLVPTASAADSRQAPTVGWLNARADFGCASGRLRGLCFKSALLAEPGSATLLELRYFTHGAYQLCKSVPVNKPGSLPAIAVRHDAIVSGPDTAPGSLADLLHAGRGETGTAIAFTRSIPAPAWLATADNEAELLVRGVVTACTSIDDLPAELLSFARARHPWIIRDPLGWLSASRYLAN
jgi:hypothetical protein